MEPIRSTYESDPDMVELVAEFAAELPARAARLQELLDRAAWDELRTLAHQLKGAGGGYGFPRVSEVAAVLEQALRERAAEGVVRERARELWEVLRAVVGPELP
jgi:HPt (histidine-containing phosphotransfer) domain-containing protein